MVVRSSPDSVIPPITFILEHPDVVEVYLKDQELLWEELKVQHPLSPDMLQCFVRTRELLRKSA